MNKMSHYYCTECETAHVEGQGQCPHDEAAERGAVIARVLQCTPDRNRRDRWHTTEGVKSPLGLYRLVEYLMEGGQP